MMFLWLSKLSELFLFLLIHLVALFWQVSDQGSFLVGSSENVPFLGLAFSDSSWGGLKGAFWSFWVVAHEQYLHTVSKFKKFTLVGFLTFQDFPLCSFFLLNFFLFCPLRGVYLVKSIRIISESSRKSCRESNNDLILIQVLHPTCVIQINCEGERNSGT